MLFAQRIGIIAVLIGSSLIIGSCAVDNIPEVQQIDGIALLEADPNWPAPMPEDWSWGQVLGVSVDSQDHIWVTHSAQVVEFDPDGNLLRTWGGPEAGPEWPGMLHGLFVDHNDYVWSAAREQHTIFKFTKDGEVVLTIGQMEEMGNSHDPYLLGRPAELYVDPDTNELYVADGYTNRRIIVYDAESGEYLRQWGAYGNEPDDDYQYPEEGTQLSQQFRLLHGITSSKDDLVYVADRTNSRVQVFNQDGTFVMEQRVSEGPSAAFSLAFSTDPDQHFLYVADGTAHRILILRRETLEVLGEVGSEGSGVGQLGRPHNIATDSKGNLYVAEANPGMRAQKFSFMGIGSF
tara:strand:+ start:56351 stop:57394 length:1044 start_codon:yes stop_codon:yes gene_type:complete